MAWRSTRPFRARRRPETWILARLATAGVSLFLFLAILCKFDRVAASRDAASDCYDTRVLERERAWRDKRFTSRWPPALANRVCDSQAARPLHIVLLKSCASPRRLESSRPGSLDSGAARAREVTREVIPCGRRREAPHRPSAQWSAMRYSAKRRVGALSLFRVSAALTAAVSSLAPAPLKSRSAFGMGPWNVLRDRFGRQGGEQSCGWHL